MAADLTTFNILLKACGASGRADLAVVFYKDIQQRGDLTMDVVTYSSLINVSTFVKPGMRESQSLVEVLMY